MPTSTLREAERAATSDYSHSGIIGEALALVLRDILNSDLGDLLLYSFRI
jgi:hypothetical protein